MTIYLDLNYETSCELHNSVNMICVDYVFDHKFGYISDCFCTYGNIFKTDPVFLRAEDC